MNRMNQLICPVSHERVDENRVRVTALLVVLTMGSFLITGAWYFPAFLVLDFYIRAFTRLRFSPFSWMAHLLVKASGTGPVWIDKAPKVFAARVGLLFSMLTSAAALLSLPLTAYIAGSTLVVFAFLECGINFCAGCWVYTYVVYPLVRKDDQ